MDRFAEMDPERVAAVARVEAEAAQTKDLAEAIHLIINHLTDLVGADGAVVDLERDGALISCFATAYLAHEVGRTQDIATSVAGRCYSEGTVLRSPSIQRDPRFPGDAAGRGTLGASLISVPLHVHGPAVGLVRLVSASESYFGDEDVSIAKAMTGTLARILMNAVRMESRHEVGDQQLLSSGNHSVRFAERRKVELRQAERYGYPVTILLCRLTGYVTVEILGRLSSLVRSTDECFRLDAAEFAIMMPGASMSDADTAGNRLAAEVERTGQGVGVEWEVRPLNAPGWEVA